ncbi:DUF305 domain-containing protein [Nonomuraea sp. NBC_01738]|uniref:DUF305 domain-containing protein n=1 Tax=Nonomuraea sp. NBC_01738 TaxID=2976003 RepID=UPI002E10A05E|nr:DUF305 domain-containing protein [Nonomuraea sp. NBC_01738]
MKKTIAALLLLMLATACGQPAVAEPVNADDVMFAQMMIPHHRQGIEIVRQVTDRPVSKQLKTLASAIQVTQDDEVKRMIGWLQEWGQPITPPSNAHAHHGGLPETDREQIARLKKARNFERDFINLLIAHQDDAVNMARIELYNGINPSAKQWADQVVASRQQQIEQLKLMLKAVS